MNKRLERKKAEAERNRSNRKGLNRKMLLSVVICMAIMVLGGTATRLYGGDRPSAPVEEVFPPVDDLRVEGEDWRLLIVSPASLLDRSFRVSLYEVEGKKVDVRMASALMEMLDAARADGVSLTLCSTYRSVSTQRRLYERKLNYYKNLGYNEEKCRELAGEYVQPPGASEHHTGLAVDFFSDGDASLTETFAKTPAYAWFTKHAAEYGFVERYPKGKEEITGIGWEPWHYRYVGKTHAEAMQTAGLCLEEYVAQRETAQ